jgi:2-dehydro-3-deoxyphosphooctonate aldolase (KDO 8-P synthase)
MTVKIENLEVSNDAPLILIAGPCVIESETLAQDIAGTVKEITSEYKIPYIFKSSFDKANRTSLHSYRGPGIEDGLRILQSVKDKINVPVLTDVHEDTPLDEVSSVVDVLQTPAFLCRQTNFILKVAAQNKPVNIKKGQFLSPWDMENVVKKAKSQGNNNILVCERGYSFGYNNLVSDMRSLVIMKETKCPVIFDATHSLQLPGGKGNTSDGQKEYIQPLSRAATAVGIAGIFIETHPDPDNALSDGPNSLPLNELKPLLEQLRVIDDLVKTNPNQ